MEQKTVTIPFDLETAKRINIGGIQELHHKIEPKTLQYWGEDSGILIGITPIYKRHLWSEEVNVINDKQ